MCMIDGLPCTPGTRVVWDGLASMRIIAADGATSFRGKMTGIVVGLAPIPWGQDWSSLPPKPPCPYYTVRLDTPYTWAKSDGRLIAVAQLWVLADALEVMKERLRSSAYQTNE